MGGESRAIENTGRMPVRPRPRWPCHRGGIWLWMGGEDIEYRIQNTEFRMANDEVKSFDFATKLSLGLDGQLAL
jgi:hypothetical protein